MILIAVHINDPKDVPAKVIIEFPDQITCEQSRQTMQYWVKFESFKIDGRCVKK